MILFNQVDTKFRFF